MMSSSNNNLHLKTLDELKATPKHEAHEAGQPPTDNDDEPDSPLSYTSGDSELSLSASILYEAKVREAQQSIKITDGRCQNCQRLFEDIAREIEDPHSLHHEDVFSLEAARRSGCKTCALFIGANAYHIFKHFYSQKSSSTPHYKGRMIVFIDEEPNSLALKDEIIRPQTSKYLSLAKHLLSEYSSKHKDCIPNNENTPLPTRLLCISDARTRLISTALVLRSPLRYATLSHCWGSIDFLKLKEDNFDSFLQDIPEQKLSKTFQDAIRITRDLGLQYIWIDSLCIIQDSKSDWKTESARICSVYGGSTINIAAASSVNGHGGCFFGPSIDNKYPAFRYQFSITTSSDTITYELAPLNLYQSCVTNTHLSSRAWAFQERLLAPQTLHFSNKDVFWECREKDACGLYPEGLAKELRDLDSYRERAPLSSIWRKIIFWYSRSNLTYASDKLIALSGLARAVQNKTNDEYPAGLWRRNFEYQLLWFLNYEYGYPRPSYRAPTWSWASVDGGVLFPRAASNTLLEISSLYAHAHNVSVEPKGQDPLGEVVRGVLTLSCILPLVHCTAITPRDYSPDDLEFPPRYLISFKEGSAECRICFDCDEDHDGLLHFLLLKGSTKRQPYLQGLILRKVVDGSYRRLGYFSSNNYESDFDEQFVLELQRIVDCVEKSDYLDPAFENEMYPDERFLIRIE